MILIYVGKYENFKLIENYLIYYLKCENYDDFKAKFNDNYMLITDDDKIIMDDFNISSYLIDNINNTYKNVEHLTETFYLKEIRKQKFKKLW